MMQLSLSTGRLDRVAIGLSGLCLVHCLATAVALLNPTVVVIGGDLALTREHLLVGVRERLYERTVSALTSSLAVVESRLGGGPARLTIGAAEDLVPPARDRIVGAGAEPEEDVEQRWRVYTSLAERWPAASRRGQGEPGSHVGPAGEPRWT
mgnify:CR=1 FL=1